MAKILWHNMERKLGEINSHDIKDKQSGKVSQQLKFEWIAEKWWRGIVKKSYLK